MQTIPVFINNLNRLKSLHRLLNWLRSHNNGPVTIIGNGSTYEPLIRYYHEMNFFTSVKVFYNNRNCGPHVFWDRSAINGKKPWLLGPNKLGEIKGKGLNWHLNQNTPFIYTDSDCCPSSDCPTDLIPHMLSLYEKFPSCGKVGAGLRIDNLPDSFHNKQKVIKVESFYSRYNQGTYAWAPVDTTFALYPPYAEFSCDWNNMRTTNPYLVEHADWYQDSNNLTEEEKYYKDHVFTWWKDVSLSI